MSNLIDTSSLFNLARYVMPFDCNEVVLHKLTNDFESGRLILLDKVYIEARRVQQGLVLKAMPFLANINKKLSSDPLTKKQNEQIDTYFIRGGDRNRLEKFINQQGQEVNHYPTRRTRYLNTADPFLVFIAKDNSYAVISEEMTGGESPNPEFKKLPILCSQLGVKYSSVVGYLQNELPDLTLQ